MFAGHCRRTGTQRHLTVNKHMENVKRRNFKGNNSPILSESHFWSILILHLFTDSHNLHANFRCHFFHPQQSYLPQLDTRSPHPVTEKKSSDMFDTNTLKPRLNATPLQTATPCSWVMWMWVWGHSNSPSFSIFPRSSVRRTASRCLGRHTAWRNVHSHPVDTDSMYRLQEESVFPENNSQEFIPPLKKKKIHRTLSKHTKDTGHWESLSKVALLVILGAGFHHL